MLMSGRICWLSHCTFPGCVSMQSKYEISTWRPSAMHKLCTEEMSHTGAAVVYPRFMRKPKWVQMGSNLRWTEMCDGMCYSQHEDLLNMAIVAGSQFSLIFCASFCRDMQVKMVPSRVNLDSFTVAVDNHKDGEGKPL